MLLIGSPLFAGHAATKPLTELELLKGKTGDQVNVPESGRFEPSVPC
jgi:hypothetical protein